MADESHQNRPFFPVRGRLPSCPALWRDASHRVRWRDAFHGVPWPGWNRALHRIVTTGPGCNPAFQGDAISTGGSREAWGWSCRRAVAGGETVAQWGGPSGGAPAAEEGSECATAEGTAGQRGGGGGLRAVSVPVQAHEPVLDPAGTKPSCVWTLWRLSGAMSVGIYLRAHPPRQPVQKLKCAPLSARARGRPEVERRPPNPNNTPQAPLCSRRSTEKRRRPPPPCHWKALPRKSSLPQKAPAERFPGGPRTPPTNTFSKDQAGLAPAIRVPILNKDL